MTVAGVAAWVRRIPLTTAIPVAAIVVMAGAWGRSLHPGVSAAIGLVLGLAVMAAVHHAEVVAHRVGEPYGSLVLAVAVTVIEVALIVTLMISGGPETQTLARDTVFAAAMITCNGIVGLSLLAAAFKYDLAIFNAEGAGAALGTVATLATLTLVLPTFTTSEPGPEFSSSQLAFAAVASLGLYALFVATQTRRHRDFFLPLAEAAEPDQAAASTLGACHRTCGDGERVRVGSNTKDSVSVPSGGDDTSTSPDKEANHDDHSHAEPPTARAAVTSFGFLLIALIAVVGLAKVESPAIENAVRIAGFPQSFVGVVIALLILLPETFAAVRAARLNRVQTSLNLALGSAMASIGLTIPTIAIASIWLEGPLLLGLGPTQMVLLGLTVVVTTLTVVPGRATRLQAGVHLCLLAAFLILAVNP